MCCKRVCYCNCNRACSLLSQLLSSFLTFLETFKGKFVKIVFNFSAIIMLAQNERNLALANCEVNRLFGFSAFHFPLANL